MQLGKKKKNKQTDLYDGILNECSLANIFVASSSSPAAPQGTGVA